MLVFMKYSCNWPESPYHLLTVCKEAPLSHWFSPWRSKRHPQARVSSREACEEARSTRPPRPPTHFTISPSPPARCWVSLPVAVVAFKGLCTCVFPVVPRKFIASCKTPLTPFPRALIRLLTCKERWNDHGQWREQNDPGLLPTLQSWKRAIKSSLKG